MAAYASYTKTMLHAVPRGPAHILEEQDLPKRDLETKPQLPTKRKIESVCGLGSFSKSITIKPGPGSTCDKRATFKPVRIIGRAQLPLTFLDTSVDGTFAPNHLFAGSIDILEGSERTQAQDHSCQQVLIARHEATEKLYAIERVQPRVFSVCGLACWIAEEDVEKLWDQAGLGLYPQVARPVEDGFEVGLWWQHATVEIRKQNRPRKCARLSMLKLKPATIEPGTQPQPANTVDSGPISLPPEVNPVGMIDPGTPPIPTMTAAPQQLLEALVQQYLDAVYLSKTSLAYFAKGPIIRIRNAFVSTEKGAPPTYELVAFLRSMLLSHKASEKKYQEKLPDVIRAIPPGSFSDDEVAPKYKKSKKKIKLSRDGLYPQEEGVVRKWWTSELADAEHHGEETLDQRIRRRISDLRVRETLAQLILMLEIIALEALPACKGLAQIDVPPAGDGDSQPQPQAAKPKKRKKMDDVNLLLDLLLDKLCIWQSVGQDGILDFDAESVKRGENSTAKDATGDRLQSFCVEVIIPFYMARLPEQAKMISKKLGGPVQKSPVKRKAMRPPAVSRKSGEPKEPAQKKARRSLSRVATDTAAQRSQRGSRAPSLHRSATDSTVMDGIKRETSEVPLAAIPFQRSPSQAARQSLSHLKHLKGRQIDLGAPSPAAAAKLKQKKRVEEELQEAIATLKKPNRGLAAGNYIDEIERKGLGSANRPRKPTTTVRKGPKGVQVAATPRVTKRTKDVVEATPIRRNAYAREDAEPAPPSSGFRVPSSGVRPFALATVQNASETRRTGLSIGETPSRAPPRKLLELDVPGQPDAAIFATPAKRRAPSPPTLQSTSPQSPSYLATPVKDTPIAPRTIFSTPRAVRVSPLKDASETPSKATPIRGTPLKPSNAEAPGRPSWPFSNLPNTSADDAEPDIFAALGWNDDDEFL